MKNTQIFVFKLIYKTQTNNFIFYFYFCTYCCFVRIESTLSKIIIQKYKSNQLFSNSHHLNTIQKYINIKVSLSEWLIILFGQKLYCFVYFRDVGFLMLLCFFFIYLFLLLMRKTLLFVCCTEPYENKVFLF